MEVAAAPFQVGGINVVGRDSKRRRYVVHCMWAPCGHEKYLPAGVGGETLTRSCHLSCTEQRSPAPRSPKSMLSGLLEPGVRDPLSCSTNTMHRSSRGSVNEVPLSCKRGIQRDLTADPSGLGSPSSSHLVRGPEKAGVLTIEDGPLLLPLQHRHPEIAEGLEA